MINAFKGKYIKFKNETNKLLGHYCVIEIKLKQQNHTQVMLFNESGLVLAANIKTILPILGYRNYVPIDIRTTEFGVGGLTPLVTKGNSMLEVLAVQMGFSMEIFATAFGTGLLQLADTE